MTIKRMAEELKKNREGIERRQKEILKALPEGERNRSSRNRNCHGGWTVPGNSAWTVAVKMAGLPWDYFWSGSLPTPSTQYWIATANFLEELEA